MNRPLRRKIWLAALLAALASSSALAQVTGTVTGSWTNPTTDTNAQPLTGANALTKIQLFISNSSIPANFSGNPTVEVLAVGGVVPQNYVHTANSGSTVFLRAKACNATGCSVLSAQASVLVPFPPAPPNVPTNVTLTINITPP